MAGVKSAGDKIPGFSVGHRGGRNWEITAGVKVVFRICTTDPNHVYVYDWFKNKNIPAQHTFQSLTAAMSYCTDTLMCGNS